MDIITYKDIHIAENSSEMRFFWIKSHLNLAKIGNKSENIEFKMAT